MISEKNLNLIIDLAKLIRKYGPDTFDELSEIFLSEEKTRELSKLLKNISAIAEQSKPTSKVHSSARLKSSNQKTVRGRKKENLQKPKSERMESYNEDRGLNAWSNIILDDDRKR
jgi:hypothetical protein